MTKKIFRSTFLVAVTVLLLCLTLLLGAVYRYFEAQVLRELQSEAQYIAHAVEQMGEDFLKDAPNAKRITIVAPDGTVLYDTATDPDGMENHGDRTEIRQALQTGEGQSERYSQTLTQKTFNYAVRMEDGTVLRLSTTQNTVIVLLAGMLQPILIILVLTLVLSGLLASWETKSVVTPINALDLERPGDNQTYEELTPLLSKIAQYQRENRRQLRAAQKQQEEFRLITENMTEGFLVIDSDTRLLTYNTAALRLLGLNGKPDGSVFSLDRSEKFRETVSKALRGERAECAMERSGRCYQLLASPVRENEKIIGAVLVILDETEKIQRDKLRREFSSNVSHELKTPLTSISGFAELMKQGIVPPEDVVDFSQRIYDEAQRLIGLVNDILKLSRLESGADLYQIETVDLYGIAVETAERLRSYAGKRGITISVLGEHAEMQGARKILSELVGNLCDNAIKYNVEGGKVELLVTQEVDQVKLVVRDTGVGIAPEHQDRVFERFYRVDKSHSKEVGGTGLGLSIVKHGAAYHHAQILLRSEPGKGTAITVQFPRVYMGESA